MGAACSKISARAGLSRATEGATQIQLARWPIPNLAAFAPTVGAAAACAACAVDNSGEQMCER
jgi:hypothetical protein